MFEEQDGATPVRRRSRKLLVGLLTAGLVLAGVTVAGLSFANAADSTDYIDADGKPATVSATAISGTSTTDYDMVAGSSYVCTGTVNLRSLNAAAAAKTGTVNLILADGCHLTVGPPASGNQAVYIAASSTLNIYSQSGNTGRLTASGAATTAGISTYATSSTVNIYGGRIYAQGGVGAAGIGGWYNHDAGTIKIAGRAYVQAWGGASGTSGAAGAGIGGGGSTFGTGSYKGWVSITVSTTGMVQAFGGTGTGPAVNIGTGGGTKSNGDAVTTVKAVDTVSVTRSITGGGSSSTVKYQNYAGSTTDNDVSNVAVGSQITWSAAPASGYSLTSAKGNNVVMGGSGNAPTFPIKTGTPATQTAAFIFGQNTTLTQTVTPASPQTRPGNVTVTGTLKTATGGTGVNAVNLELYINDVKQTATAQTNASGVATFTITSPPIGTYSYFVSWPGNDSYAASSSPKITGYVVQRATQSALALNGLGVSYVYGDAPLALTTTGGSGDGAVSLVSSNPTVASLSDQTTAGAATLTVNRAGTFTVTQTKAQDDIYSELVRTTPVVTVNEAIPQAVLTRTGGNTVTEPVDVTLQVAKRGTGTTPQGLVQFYFKSTKLGDPLPLVDGGDGTASVSLTGIPLQAMGMQSVTATFLGETGKYTTVSKSDEWYLGGLGFCKVETP